MGMKPRNNTASWVAILIAVVAVAAFRSVADDAAFSKPAPENLSDLRAIEEQVTSLAQRVLPTTVALQVGRAQASGVIVSSDGYVLTAAHVIERPGRNVTIIFSNGKTARGTTLGLNPQVDGGLVQITDSGPWPYAPIAPIDETPRPGDWCVATGNPGGFQAGRMPPVRLGRVIDADRVMIRTDCTISMGDSGGPLFDMQGRVIGIHSRIADETTMNLHVPAATYQDAWDVLKAGEVAWRPSKFLTRFDTDGDGSINRSEIPEAYRSVFDRMASKLELDPEKSYPIDDLTKSLGLEAPRSFDGRQLLLPMRFIRPSNSLAPERFAHGRIVRSAFAGLVAEARHSIVRVKHKGDEVALGTIVEGDGWIVTKASELPRADGIVCVLTDGRELRARVLSTDSSTDVAFLSVDADGLTPVRFHNGKLVPGMWLASPGQSELPLAIGIVSNAERSIPGSPGVMGVIIDDADYGPAIQQVLPGSGAAAAGIQVGDVVTHIASERVRSMVELQTAVRKHRVGEVIMAVIRRDGMKLELAVRLGMPEDTFGDMLGQGRGRGEGSTGPTWRGALNHRRDDFPSAIQHDTVLRPSDCGGPVLDSAGRVVGINIARADRTASYALTPAAILSQLDKLKATDAAAR
jgi:serine protease Do